LTNRTEGDAGSCSCRATELGPSPRGTRHRDRHQSLAHQHLSMSEISAEECGHRQQLPSPVDDCVGKRSIFRHMCRGHRTSNNHAQASRLDLFKKPVIKSGCL
jgi:hypothetical protein